jgi:hypothetical protein
MSGPAARLSPEMPDQMPIAWARSRGSGKAPVSSARLAGESAAPPAAWRAREATSTPWLGARPHSAEPRVNTARPIMNQRLRPWRSLSAPAVSSSVANTRV